ncbi:MAG: hypothetical protein A2Y65_06775 [Deltaproteobacteria bacterium RBG_13_52_11]|nr:MAG: hypothetical protein A2Y65_06775 [Deltaproteobacteria bacterium RBG_13_52_11]
MKAIAPLVLVIFLLGLIAAASHAQQSLYPWLGDRKPAAAIADTIPPPAGYKRVTVEANSFPHWLRHLPLKRTGTPVYLYNGKKKVNQDAHFAVVDINTGTQNLQQCADAVIRLRAEYLYAQGRYASIHFNFTSGDEASFLYWASGYRPKVNNNRVRWGKRAVEDTSYENFRRYLATVFAYAGSSSLSKEMKSRKDTHEVRIGDIFIQGGFPGHAIIVVDMAENKSTGKKVFLLAQSYMPAQDIHVLKNPDDTKLSPWYELDFGLTLQTPEWTFKRTDLKYFDSN